MPYTFLTGATGLLGRYLIRDLTLAGVPIAVLVRPTRKASAQHRVENVMMRFALEATQLQRAGWVEVSNAV